MNSYLTVDGTDCPVLEPKPFSPRWFSHKFNLAALRYEIAVSVESARVVWASGPFAAGAHSDMSIFDNRLKYKLGTSEFVITDAGHGGPHCIAPHPSSNFLSTKLGFPRARHEAINGRLKSFAVLSTRFRHELNKDADCFYAVLNVICVNS